MGMIFQKLVTGGDPTICDKNGNWQAQPAQSAIVNSMLIQAGQIQTTEEMAGMSQDEVFYLFSDLDILFNSIENQFWAALIYENARAILDFVRIEKYYPGGSGKYASIYAAPSSTEMDVWPLRPKDVGGTLLNSASTAAKGLYGGTSGAVYEWTTTGLTAGTTAHIIPSQTLSANTPPASVLLLGGLEKQYQPNIGGIQVSKGGNTITSPQPVGRNYRSTFGENTNVSVLRFKRPILFKPNEVIAVDVMPDVGTTSNFELLALVAAPAVNHSL